MYLVELCVLEAFMVPVAYHLEVLRCLPCFAGFVPGHSNILMTSFPVSSFQYATQELGC